MKELSEIAKQYGLKSEWSCWTKNTLFDDIPAILEICMRIEKLEEGVKHVI